MIAFELNNVIDCIRKNLTLKCTNYNELKLKRNTFSLD